LFFSCFSSSCNINIHHILNYGDYLCLNNRLNLYYCHKFPMKQLLDCNKLWTVCHFMSIQTIDVIHIQRCFLWFLFRLGYFCSYHYSLLFLLSTCFHIVINHSIICAKLVNLPYITLRFWWCYMFCTLWYL
jgi:hypothetical protein